MEHFARAIDEYRKQHPQHPNLARTLANMAYVERLVALQFRKRIDADTARRRRAASAKGPSGDVSPEEAAAIPAAREPPRVRHRASA